MKKLYLLCLFALFVTVSMILTSCDPEDGVRTHAATDEDVYIRGIVNIENCEYFKNFTTRGYAVLSHKGNCTNPIHQCK